MPETKNDPVNRPAHYTDGKIEVIDFIEDKRLGYHLGNAVKYISRAGKKDPSKTEEDLKKALWYLERYYEKGLQRKHIPLHPSKGKISVFDFIIDKNINADCAFALCFIVASTISTPNNASFQIEQAILFLFGAIENLPPTTSH